MISCYIWLIQKKKKMEQNFYPLKDKIKEKLKYAFKLHNNVAGTICELRDFMDVKIRFRYLYQTNLNIYHN